MVDYSNVEYFAQGDYYKISSILHQKLLQEGKNTPKLHLLK
jgi:hypothetical protein